MHVQCKPHQYRFNLKTRAAVQFYAFLSNAANCARHIMATERSVEFSTDLVRFVNENRKKQETFYLLNRAGLSKKLRVAIAKQSDKVGRHYFSHQVLGRG